MKNLIIIGVLILGIFSQTFNVPMKFISPLSQKKVSALSVVRAKLEQKQNTYSVKKTRSFIAAAQAASNYDESTAYAVIDYDTGEVIAEKSLSRPVPIASVTKIMTAIIALDLAAPNELFSVTQRAANVIPTKIVVEPWETFILTELLHASLLTSANDATEVIREGIDTKYGDKVFIDAMNIKAKFIGLKNSHFVNPQGFDAREHYSSVEDLAILTHYALTHYPLIAEIVEKDQEYLPETNRHKRYVLYNWNGLLGVYPDISGMKIGNTEDAGMTTIVTAEREGKKLIAIVLGAPGILERDLWASQLLDLGYETKMSLPPINVTEEQLRAKYDTWVPWN